MIYNVIGVNVAPNGIAYATSTMKGTADPSIINDGSCTTRDLPSVWQSATTDRDKEYIEIDLGSTQYIYCIRILGMSTCAPEFPQCQKRMFKLRIEIRPDGDPSIDPAALSYYKTGKTGIETSVTAQLATNTTELGLYTLPTTSFDQTIQVNQALGQYVRIRPSLTDGDGFMNLSQVIVYDVLGLNVSVGKNTYATSSITGASPSDIAVDGNMSIRSLPYVWHSNTRDRNKEFFEVDLGSSQTIIAVRIIGRKDCPLPNMCENRMKGLRIEINPDTSIQAMESYKMQKSRPTDQQMQGRQININDSSQGSSIRVRKIIGYEKVDEPDPSLPIGYVRLWNTKKRTYVYQDSKGQIVPHPVPPSMRSNRGQIRRPPGIPIATREDEALMVGGGFRPLSNDVQDLESLTVAYPWTMYFDTNLRKHYYYNVETGIDTWDQPYVPRKPMDGEVTYGDFGLMPKWNKYLDDSIHTFFYYKPSTGETRWDHPNPPPGPHGLVSVPGPYEPSYKMYVDPTSGGTFYLNMATKETVWELPISIQGVVRPVRPVGPVRPAKTAKPVKPVTPVKPVRPATKSPIRITTVKAKPTPKGTRKSTPAVTAAPTAAPTEAPTEAPTTVLPKNINAPTPLDSSRENIWGNGNLGPSGENGLWNNASTSPGGNEVWNNAGTTEETEETEAPTEETEETEAPTEAPTEETEETEAPTEAPTEETEAPSTTPTDESDEFDPSTEKGLWNNAAPTTTSTDEFDPSAEKGLWNNAEPIEETEETEAPTEETEETEAPTEAPTEETEQTEAPSSTPTDESDEFDPSTEKGLWDNAAP